MSQYADYAAARSEAFPNNLPTVNTENRRFLVATVAFSQLPGAPAPDFILPANFLQISGDLVVYSGSPDEVSYNLLPTDGVLSINRAGTSGINSPTNIFGASGSVTAPSSGQDCNQNGVPDETDITNGTSTDCDSNGVPDECNLAGNDCDGNGIHDSCQSDADGDGVIDTCDGCPLDPLGSVDSDGDGVCDASDVCPGGDDGIDTDGDLIPDDGDICPLDPFNDSNGDGICGDGTTTNAMMPPSPSSAKTIAHFSIFLIASIAFSKISDNDPPNSQMSSESS